MNYIAVLFKKPDGFRDFDTGYSPRWANSVHFNIRKWSSAAKFTVITDFEGGFSKGIKVVPFRFPERGWASMMEAYNPELVGERSIVIGLDTLFVGKMDEIEKQGHHFITTKCPHSKKLANALVSVNKRAAGSIWDKWVANRDRDLKNNEFLLNGQWSEMLWLRKRVRDPKYWEDILPEYILSYKCHCGPKLNKKAKVVYFHGKPKQNDLLRLNWVRENWILKK